MTLDLLGQITGIVSNVLFAASIVAAFVPQVRKHFIRHALTIIRESNDDL